jgi:hypothetical protein
VTVTGAPRRDGPGYPRPSGQGYSPWRGVCSVYPRYSTDRWKVHRGPRGRLHRRLQPLLRVEGQARPKVPLALSLVRPGQTLEQITYFTARVRNDPEGRQRQSDYLDALASHSPLVAVVDGRFQEKPRHCRNCGAAWTVYEEKETDVSIAAALIEDAVLDRYDTALLISADSDLCPAILTMKRLCPEKRIIAAWGVVQSCRRTSASRGGWGRRTD